MTDIVCSGALYYALNTKRFLFLHRNDTRNGNSWGLVGGTTHPSETAFEGLVREISEEIGSVPVSVKTVPLETFVSTDGRFSFHTYLVVVHDEFIPVLNQEHSGYAWVSFGHWPRPLHQGLRNTLQNKYNLSKLETVFQVIDLISK